jgi:hypothetical protein
MYRLEQKILASLLNQLSENEKEEFQQQLADVQEKSLSK